MERIIFEKAYTRDHCFILQEIWDDYLTRDYFGKQNPYFPPQINYLYDGAAELWDNKKAIKWFIDRLLAKNKADINFLRKIIKKHKDTANRLNKILKRKHLNSVKELKEFLELIKKGTYTFLAFYYSAVDKRTPRKLRETALRVRERDIFYDSADHLIRKTIEHLYPRARGLTISILMKELNSPPNNDVLKKRFKNCIMIIDGTTEITTINSFAKRNKKYKFLFDKILDTNILKGQTANSGYARGRVKVLRRVVQIKDFKRGEILVTPMTTPDFVPAIKKAAAIVTDEGGITSHAAIVSREFKKPCIISTKIATKVLKDGDFVEVDANKGIVKKF